MVLEDFVQILGVGGDSYKVSRLFENCSVYRHPNTLVKKRYSLLVISVVHDLIL